THDAINVEQRILTAFILVGSQGVADIGTNIDMVDVENIDLFNARVEQGLENFLIDLVTGFAINLTGSVIDDVFGKIGIEKIVFRRLDCLEALLGKLAG